MTFLNERSDAAGGCEYRAPPAMILAAGLGTRLRPLTTQLAKPAIPFPDRPLIHSSLDLLREGGVREICVNLHHLPETVRRAVERWPARGVRIHYSEEPRILGTAGAFARASRFLSSCDCFVAINGKIYFEQALQPVLEAHRRSGSLVTLVVIPHSGRESFNPVLLDDRQRVRTFALKGQVTDFSDAFIFTGLQIVSSRLLERIQEGYSDTVKDVYPDLLAGGQVRAFISQSFWCENSTLRRYLENVFRVATRLQRKGRPPLARVSPDLIRGENFQAGEGTRFSRVLAWNDVRVGSATGLHNVILCNGCEVPANLELRDMVLTPLGVECPGLTSRSLGSCLAWALE